MASRREFLRVLGAAPVAAVGALAVSNAYDLKKERDDALRVAREALRMAQHNAFLAAHPMVVVEDHLPVDMGRQKQSAQAAVFWFRNTLS